MCLVVTLLIMTQQTIANSLLRFDMPNQSLDTALVTFGSLTGYSVLVASNLAVGRQAAAVYGDFEPREALQRLLVGTGLTARYSGSNAFTLIPSSSMASDEIESIDEHTRRQVELQNTSYPVVLQASITRALCVVQRDDFGRYRVVFQLWITDSGAVRDVRLLESTGLKKRDTTILDALHRVVMNEPPPLGLAQPITILLTPRPNPAEDCRPYLSATD